MASLVSKFIGMWVRPWATMASLNEEENSIKSSMIFIVVLALISGIISSTMGMFFPPEGLGDAVPAAAVWSLVLLIPLFSFLGSFIGAFFLMTLISGMLTGTMSQYKTSYRLLALMSAYQPVSSLLSPIPKVGNYLSIIFGIWVFIVLIRGIIIVFNTDKVKTWVIMASFVILIALFGVMANFLAEQQAFGPAGTSSSVPDFDLDTEDDELEKQLNALEEKEKADATKK